VLNWEQVKWELDDKGELIIDSVFLECPACYFHIMDKHKSELLANGKWIATAKHKTMPGFHISSLYSPWVKFHELAKEYLEIGDSEGNEKMQEFLNLKLGEPIEAIVEDLDIALLESHKLVYNAELPDGVLYLTCGVDVQDNRLEYQIIGWGENNQCWVITNQMILGNPEQDEVWDSLDGIICRGYSLPDGRKLPIGASCVDSGYLADRVYKFTTPREHLRVAAVKGFGGEGIPIINNPSSKNRTHTKVMKVGVDAAKAVIYSRLRNHTKGKNYIHFPLDITHGCGDEYYKQLNSERRVLDLKHGVKRFIWKKIRDRNEALDTFVYALAAYEMAAPNLEYIKEQLANQQFETDDDDDADGEENLISSGIKLY
jgi:phage terminase large subunit GpA-like protein